MSILVMMVVPKAPVLSLSKAQKMHVMRLPNSTATNGRAACLKFAKTALPDRPQVVLQVLAAGSEEVDLEPVEVSAAGEVDLLVAEDLAAGSEDAEATVVDLVLLLLLVLTPGLPLHLQILLLTTLPLVASAARLSMSATYVLPSLVPSACR